MLIGSRCPDDACLDDAYIGMGCFSQKSVFNENRIIRSFFLCFCPCHHIIQLIQGKDIAVMSAVIFCCNAGEAVLNFCNGCFIKRSCVHKNVRLKFVSGRNGEIMFTSASCYDNLHESFLDSGFINDNFGNFSKFIRCCDRTDA